MELHYSDYNHLLTLGEGSYLLYNFLSAQQLVLDEFSLAFFRHATQKDPEHPSVRALRKRGFLVDYDELSYLRVRAQASLGLKPELDLVICPTMVCNLRCGYCFERDSAKSMGAMSEKIRSALLRVVEASLATGRYTALRILWYGGEPLLGFETVERLSSRFQALCEERSVSYTASMISNGTLLTPERAERLYALGLRRIQITLDGPRAVHDASRPAADGKSSFDAITANLRALRVPLSVDLRCNLHRDNLRYLPELERLAEELNCESGAEITLYTAGMKAACGDTASAALELPEEQFAVEGRPVDENMLSRRPISCGRLSASTIIVDSSGALYKCEGKVGRPEEAFGNISDCEGEWMHYLLSDGVKRGILSRWMSMAFPEDEKCLHCKLLPVCMGGCPADRLAGQQRCNRAIFDLDSYVRLVTKHG